MINQLGSWFKVGCLCTALMSLSLATSSVEASENPVYAQPKSSSSAQAALPLANVELNIGMSLLPPFSFLTDSLTDVQGIDVDIVKELQKRTGFKIKGNKISFMNFGELFEVGRAGNLDIIASGITLSEARRAYFDFSEPYLAVPFVLVVRNDGNIKDSQDLKNCTVATEAGSLSTEFIPNVEQLNLTTINTTSIFMSMFAVHNHQADAMVVDEPMAHFYINNWDNSNLKVVQTISQPSAAGFLFKKNANFTPYLQQAFADMLEDGTIAQIFTKYMGEDKARQYINYVKSNNGQALSFNQ